MSNTAYKPRLGDAAIDLARCLNASFGANGFKSKNFIKFYNNSLQIISNNKNSISITRLKLIMSRIKCAGDSNLEVEKRREDLLLASNTLLKEYVRSVKFDNKKEK